MSLVAEAVVLVSKILAGAVAFVAIMAVVGLAIHYGYEALSRVSPEPDTFGDRLLKYVMLSVLSVMLVVVFWGLGSDIFSWIGEVHP